ncbi:hypothetical protein BEN49_17515 [Hymenobacter coccineus]|uniref:Erythromycin esterase n=1 Tax=Hymenobacter coccineus TaxID=1908235 RepID=A0A1G1TME0_9BACT|nr:hypothetical protein BEN49_17515 [Hymenobacter coccineus]
MLLLWSACLGAAGVRAQAPGPRPVPARALRSLSPADTSFAELEFLRSEIGGARVVFLGEPTHGEGNVLAAKARLVAFLQQRMGFTTLGMESGFFELHKAQQSIAAGKSVAKNLRSSVFPVWTATQEFQAVGPLLGPDGLRLMGFDPQLSGDYSDDLADDLEDFLESEKGADAVDYDLLGDVVDYMAAHYAVPPAPKPAEFEAVLAQADRLLGKAAGAPPPAAAPRPPSGSSACVAWGPWPATTPPTTPAPKPPPPSWPPTATRATPRWPTTCCGTCASTRPKK